jgi:hypothetical protein
MIAILTIGGTCSVTRRDLARSEPRQTDSSAFVRTKWTHVDRPPGIAVSDARCRNYPRTVASEELGLTASTVNLRVSLPQAISRSARAETRSAPQLKQQIRELGQKTAWPKNVGLLVLLTNGREILQVRPPSWRGSASQRDAANAKICVLMKPVISQRIQSKSFLVGTFIRY